MEKYYTYNENYLPLKKIQTENNISHIIYIKVFTRNDKQKILSSFEGTFQNKKQNLAILD